MVDVGRAKGIALPADAVTRSVGFTSHMPPAMKASMALDLDRGNRLELPWLGARSSTWPSARRADADPQHDGRDCCKPYIKGTPA